jgi:peptidoglycan hydrolase-like protein with peptidoglycan-binding domain
MATILQVSGALNRQKESSIMKLSTLITIMTFLAGLLVAGIALGQQQQQQQEDQAQLQISAQQLNSAQVRELQESLQKNGVDPGPIDGKMGPLTKQAIQLFQQQQNLASTGDVNDKTLEALDIEVQEFMGLSPEFGEDQKKQQQEKKEQEQQ